VNNQFNKDNREFMSRTYELIVALTVRNHVLNDHLGVFLETFILNKKIVKCWWLTINP